jgi:hypothetical protein
MRNPAHLLVILSIIIAGAASCMTAQVYSGQAKSPTMKRRIAVDRDTPVGVSVILCGFCSTPYDYQVEEARHLLEDTCRGDFDLLEEGERISPSNMTFVAPVVGGGLWAQNGVRRYYWIARCHQSRE